uniref:Cytochrome b n=1 Tax=Azumapecten farreri TaxID=106299 RepID=C6YXJ1_AZUFA|nr:cytochrome b [Azumapecten farreri]ABQ96655.1 cytochrome b [Azumapecten farreri]
MFEWKEGVVFPALKGVFYDLPCPSNLSIWWNFGSLLGVCMGGQVVTGWFLSFYYTAHEDMAFMSVSFIMKEVEMGWAFRGFHINVANFMFACLYIHVCRGLYYGSFRLYKVWLSGVVLLLLVMLTAFTGYVLPWGQMSYWAAQVISSMVTAIPVVGKDIAIWIWGGYAVGNITLKRLFSVHFLIPFIILAVFFLHLNFLHESGSGNPLGVDTDCCLVRFHSFFTVKDLVGVLGSCGVLCFVVAFHPYMLVDGENFVACDYMETPQSIHPEWYFLFAYAILRSVPSKAGGIILMLCSILVLVVIPELWVGKMESLGNYFLCQCVFWLWVGNFCILTFVGSQGVEEPYITAGEYGTMFYFGFFPFLGLVQRYEDFLIRSISKSGPG